MLIGGAGADIVAYFASTGAVTIDLAAQTAAGGDAEGNVLSGIEGAIGSAFNDVLTGDAGANILEGGVGADRSGRRRADTVDYATSVAGVIVNLTTQTATGGDATAISCPVSRTPSARPAAISSPEARRQHIEWRRRRRCARRPPARTRSTAGTQASTPLLFNRRLGCDDQSDVTTAKTPAAAGQTP